MFAVIAWGSLLMNESHAPVRAQHRRATQQPLRGLNQNGYRNLKDQT
jgi:hypothetical protein